MRRVPSVPPPPATTAFALLLLLLAASSPPGRGAPVPLTTDAVSDKGLAVLVTASPPLPFKPYPSPHFPSTRSFASLPRSSVAERIPTLGPSLVSHPISSSVLSSPSFVATPSVTRSIATPFSYFSPSSTFALAPIQTYFPISTIPVPKPFVVPVVPTINRENPTRGATTPTSLNYSFAPPSFSPRTTTLTNIAPSTNTFTPSQDIPISVPRYNSNPLTFIRNPKTSTVQSSSVRSVSTTEFTLTPSQILSSPEEAFIPTSHHTVHPFALGAVYRISRSTKNANADAYFFDADASSSEPPRLLEIVLDAPRRRFAAIRSCSVGYAWVRGFCRRVFAADPTPPPS